MLFCGDDDWHLLVAEALYELEGPLVLGEIDQDVGQAVLVEFALGGGVKRPGFPGGSGYWIPIKGWSVRYAS